MPTAVEMKFGPAGGASLGLNFSIPLVAMPSTEHEVQGFGQSPTFTSDQVDRATSSLVTFITGLPEDERAVVTHVLAQAALANSATQA